jgi:hypothetical protein
VFRLIYRSRVSNKIEITASQAEQRDKYFLRSFTVSVSFVRSCTRSGRFILSSKRNVLVFALNASRWRVLKYRIITNVMYHHKHPHKSTKFFLFLSFHRAFCRLFNYTHQHMRIYIWLRFCFLQYKNLISWFILNLMALIVVLLSCGFCPLILTLM